MKNDYKTEFKKIYADTCKRLYAAALSGAENPADAEDIFQETYIELLNTLKSGKKIHKPKSFLDTVLRKKLSVHYKELKIRRSSIKPDIRTDDRDESAEKLFIDELDIEDSVISEALYSAVSEKLKSKPEEVQKIFSMYYGLDMKLTEIAEQLNASPSYVKNKLYRTLKELRKLYADPKTKTEEHQ